MAKLNDLLAQIASQMGTKAPAGLGSKVRLVAVLCNETEKSAEEQLNSEHSVVVTPRPGYNLMPSGQAGSDFRRTPREGAPDRWVVIDPATMPSWVKEVLDDEETSLNLSLSAYQADRKADAVIRMLSRFNA